MRFRDIERRYREALRHERKELEEYAKHEIEWAEDLLTWYKLKKMEIPDDEYRGVRFFINHEFEKKSGSLVLCYSAYCQMCKELPKSTKENSFYLVAYRFKVYALVLAKGGYDGD